MRYLKLIFLLCFALPSITKTEEVPTLTLLSGENEVTLSIKNGWNRDISGVTISPSETLPSWLTVRNVDLPLPIEKDRTIPEKIKLTFSVSKAPTGAYADVPLTLKDDRGNCWVLMFKVITDGSETQPETFDALYENFPNPFNPSTIIPYSLKSKGQTNLVIFNTLGQVVKTLVNESQSAGLHEVRWDGCDDLGHEVSSGIYFYQLTNGSFMNTRRMLLVK